MNLKRILVIESDDAMSRLACHVLQKAGYQTEAYFDGRAGLRRAAQWSPDVILCDASVPGLPGAALVARVKEDPAIRGIPVILMCAWAVNLPVVPDALLPKPFVPAQLLRTVDDVLSGGKP